MVDTTVKYFSSTMSGAPALSGTAGTLIGVLDACLVNGFGSVTLDSLVVASNVATGTVSAGHNFSMVGNTGPVITIAGATPAGLNGEWRIASVPGASTFTFATTGITDQTATGTITAKRSPAGSEKVFSDTNKACYQSSNLLVNSAFLRVDDTGTTNARIIGYEEMTDVNTGTNPFPTNAKMPGGLYCYKSQNTSSCEWLLIADNKCFYLFNNANNATFNGGCCFGKTKSYVSSDTYNTIIKASTNESGSFALSLVGASGGYVARNFLNTELSVEWSIHTHSNIPFSRLGNAAQSYPSPIGHAFMAWPIELWESGGARGLMPGLWNPLHNNLIHKTTISFCIQLPERTLLISKQDGYFVAIDITGPW